VPPRLGEPEVASSAPLLPRERDSSLVHDSPRYRPLWLADGVSQRRGWDRDAQPAPAWAQNLIRRAYLVEDRDAPDAAGAERILETSFPCAVGDLVTIPSSVLAARAGSDSWRIVAREAAPAPYVARLIVVPAAPSEMNAAATDA
jgi:hypothetical protein